MKPASFKESTALLKCPDGMEDCDPLPVYADATRCISRWKLSCKERFQALWHGHIWLYVWSGTTQPPVALSVDKTVFLKDKHGSR